MSLKVNCFIVGWPKTGSTSLYDYIEQHPDAIVASKKDSYYFCDDLRESSIKLHGKNKFHFIDSIDQYNALIDHRDKEAIVCESSVFYTVSKTAAKNIYEYNPEAKIIILLREPKQLIKSWYNYLRVHSRETALSLIEALSLEEHRKLELSSIPKAVNIPEHVYYSSLVAFDEGIAKFKKYFPSKNIKIVFTEDLKNQTLEVTQSIFSFLDIDSSFKPDITLKNLTYKSKNVKLKWLVDTTLQPVKFFLRKVLSGKVHQLFRGLYKNMFFGKTKAVKPQDEELEEKLNSFIIPMLKRTSSLIGIDLLNKWNYK